MQLHNFEHDDIRDRDILFRPDILSTSDAARLLNVSRHSVARWCREQKLLAVRIGPKGDYRFTVSALENYIRSLRF